MSLFSFLRAPVSVPFQGLSEHLRIVERGLSVLSECLTRLEREDVSGGFQALVGELASLEEQADKAKRRLRNHLPGSWRMPVDKGLLLLYSGRQDDVLNHALLAARWLSIRAGRPGESAASRALAAQLGKAAVETARLLGPAMTGCADLLTGGKIERAEVKNRFRAVKKRHRSVSRGHFALCQALLGDASPVQDYRDAIQTLRAADSFLALSHAADQGVDALRALMAR